MKVLRSVLLKTPSAFALLCGLVAPAAAADLPSKASPPIPPVLSVEPVASWGGFYGGLTAGGGGGNFSASRRLSAYGLPRDAFVPAVTDAFNTENSRMGGFLVGFGGGYNYQISKWIVGLEADAQYFGFRGGSSAGSHLAGTVARARVYDQSSSTEFIGTVRPRVGYSFGQLMLFATGGMAVANSDNFGASYFWPGGDAFRGSNSYIRVGWTVGGGAEFFVMKNVSAKVEYLYTDLGKASFTQFDAGRLGPQIYQSNEIATSVIRIGGNFHF